MSPGLWAWPQREEEGVRGGVCCKHNRMERIRSQSLTGILLICIDSHGATVLAGSLRGIKKLWLHCVQKEEGHIRVLHHLTVTVGAVSNQVQKSPKIWEC